MSEKLDHKITTEIDYKVAVLTRFGNKAKLEVVKSGYFSHSHDEYRVFLEEIGERRKYVSNLTSLSEAAAWEAAYKEIQ